MPEARHPQTSEAIYRAGMLDADGLANDDVPGDQLEPVVLGKNAGLAHPVILLDGEPAPGQELAHAAPPTAILLWAGVVRQRRDSDTLGAAPAQRRRSRGSKRKASGGD